MPSTPKKAPADETVKEMKQHFTAQAKTVRRLTDTVQRLEKETKRLRAHSPGGAAGAPGGDPDGAKEDLKKIKRPTNKRPAPEDGERAEERTTLRLKVEDDD